MGLENIRMTTGQNELRMMWLISLVIVGLSAWYLDYEIVSYLCGLGFLMSVMQYVNAVQQPLEEITAEHQLSISGYSKVPLYISSLIAIVGGVIDLKWLMGLGVTAWIFFLFRWLQRIELSLRQLQQHRIHSVPSQDTSNSQPVPLPAFQQPTQIDHRNCLPILRQHIQLAVRHIGRLFALTPACPARPDSWPACRWPG